MSQPQAMEYELPVEAQRMFAAHAHHGMMMYHFLMKKLAVADVDTCVHWTLDLVRAQIEQHEVSALIRESLQLFAQQIDAPTPAAYPRMEELFWENWREREVGVPLNFGLAMSSLMVVGIVYTALKTGEGYRLEEEKARFSTRDIGNNVPTFHSIGYNCGRAIWAIYGDEQERGVEIARLYSEQIKDIDRNTSHG